MRAQIFHMIPQAFTRLRFRGEVRKRIHQRVIFRFRIQESIEIADRPEGEGDGLESEHEWKGDNPPECFEESSHVGQGHVPECR